MNGLVIQFQISIGDMIGNSKEYIEVETIKLSDQIKEMDKLPSLT